MSALVALLLAALAFVFALADSALLSEALGAEPEASGLRREHEHRALLFARLLAQLGTGVAAAVALHLPDRTAAQSTIAGLLVGALVVSLSEVAAREIGDASGAVALRRLQPVVWLARTLLAPVVTLAARLDDALLRALPPQAASDVTREETAEQFREIVSADAEVTSSERALLAGVFTLGDTTVTAVMVPRVDVIGVERETPWSELIDRVRSSEHSRLPVFEETIDEIVGVVYAKDLLPAVIAGDEPAAGWSTLVRPATFIPATKQIDAQLRDFRQSGSHMAVVVDEYGGTEGIVTIEDILEEIVGEIRDERDEEEAPVVAESGRRFWVSARVTLAELSEVLGVPVEHEDVTTAGGLVYELLGRVPRAGESLEIAGFRVVVERVVRRKVLRLYFERLPEPTDSVGDDAADAVERDESRRASALEPGRLPGRPTARADRGAGVEGAP